MTRPIQFATNPLFPAGPNLWNGNPNKVTPPAGVLADGFTPATLGAAEYVNAILSNYGIVLDELRKGAKAAACQFSLSPLLDPAGALPLTANAVAHAAGLGCADGRWSVAYSWRNAAALPNIYYFDAYNRTGAINGTPLRTLAGVSISNWSIGTLPANSEPRVFMYDAPAAGTPPNGRAIAWASGSVGATAIPHFATAVGAAFAVSAGAPNAHYDGAAYAATTGTLILLRRNPTGAHEIYTSTNNGANWTLRHTFPVLAGAVAFEAGTAVTVDPTTQRAFVIDSLRRVRYADAPFTVWNAADLPVVAPALATFDVATFGGRVFVLESNSTAPQAVTDESRERVWYASTTGAPAWAVLVSQINALQFVKPAPGVFGILANRTMHLTDDGLAWDSFAHSFQPGNARGFAHASGPAGRSDSAGGFVWGTLRNLPATAATPIIQSGQFRPGSVLIP